MEYQIIHAGNASALECLPAGGVVSDEPSALDLIALCGEEQVDIVLLYSENLPVDFFDLKSGVAGRILLKFSNYAIRLAAIIPPEIASQGRFHEMVLETNRGNEFRVFSNRADAIGWIQKIW